MRYLMLAAMLVGAPGCGMFGGSGNKEKPETIDAETFKKVVAVAKAIRKDPAKADEALKEAGMTRAQLEEALYQIAAEESSSEKYARAVRGGN